jgi:hypothetical protein
MKLNRALIFFAPILLYGCSATLPVAVVGHDGTILTGTNYVSTSEGSFSVTDGVLTCNGSYNPMQTSTTISMTVNCDDGRKGIIRATRDTSSSGSGTVRLDDGWEGDFLFGAAAESFF